jgi:hypothetical protein
MVAPRDAVRFVATIASLLLGGCFYVESINQRPSLDIRQDAVGDVFRNEDVSFTAVVVDPDDSAVDVSWHVYACTDATTFSSCDAESSVTGDQRNFAFTVPMNRIDNTTPTRGIRIVLDGIDDRGASSKPSDQLQLEVKDRNPDLELRRDSIYKQPGPQFVVDTPIDIFAVYGDGDNELQTLTVIRDVLSPTQVPINIVEKPIMDPAGKKQIWWELTPQVVGEWAVEVTVKDPSGNEIKKSEKMTVVADRAPCLDTVTPIVPPPGAEIFDETLFQVIGVNDDLDSYPRTSGGTLFGEPTFAWTVLGPTGGRQVVSTSKQFQFDPDVYVPGTTVEIRVEIKDRKLSPVNCADGDATCSIGATSCIQRQTWRVVAR